MNKIKYMNKDIDLTQLPYDQKIFHESAMYLREHMSHVVEKLKNDNLISGKNLFDIVISMSISFAANNLIAACAFITEDKKILKEMVSKFVIDFHDLLNELIEVNTK